MYQYYQTAQPLPLLAIQEAATAFSAQGWEYVDALLWPGLAVEIKSVIETPGKESPPMPVYVLLIRKPILKGAKGRLPFPEIKIGGSDAGKK